MENIVYLELLRLNYKITIGRIKDYEIDFIIRKNNKKAYIQVSYEIKNDETRKREIRALLKLKDNYPKYLITTDREDYSQDGIIHMNVIEFLKESENII